MPTLDEVLDGGAPPLIAILRGIRPDEAISVGRALIDAKVRMIEIPTNSPAWQESVTALTDNFGQEALIGAGTLTTAAMVEDLATAGGRLAVAPNCNADVIRAAIAHGMDVLPGIMTPTEALTAIGSGARALKLFPAASVGPGHLRALKDVLPSGTGIWAVGGIDTDNAGQWLVEGATGVAAGSSLYRPGLTPQDVHERAKIFIDAVTVL